MNALNEVDKVIIKKLIDLPAENKKEVLNFIEFIQIKQDRSFIVSVLLIVCTISKQRPVNLYPLMGDPFSRGR